MQGLVQAISTIFPSAEHRFCLRHIHENLKTTFKTNDLRELLWNAATRCTVQEFEVSMEAIRMEHMQAYEWLRKIPPQTWARSHFTGKALPMYLSFNEFLSNVFFCKALPLYREGKV